MSGNREMLGYQLRVSEAVPRGEAWIIQPAERCVMENNRGQFTGVDLRPAKLLARIVNLPSEGPKEQP